MNFIITECIAYFSSSTFPKALVGRSNLKGQTLVEFSLVFIILLVVAWIPADFGLAFYTAQIASNAARRRCRCAVRDCRLGRTALRCPQVHD